MDKITPIEIAWKRGAQATPELSRTIQELFSPKQESLKTQTKKQKPESTPKTQELHQARAEDNSKKRVPRTKTKFELNPNAILITPLEKAFACYRQIREEIPAATIEKQNYSFPNLRNFAVLLAYAKKYKSALNLINSNKEAWQEKRFGYSSESELLKALKLYSATLSDSAVEEALDQCPELMKIFEPKLFNIQDHELSSQQARALVETELENKLIRPHLLKLTDESPQLNVLNPEERNALKANSLAFVASWVSLEISNSATKLKKYKNAGLNHNLTDKHRQKLCEIFLGLCYRFGEVFSSNAYDMTSIENQKELDERAKLLGFNTYKQFTKAIYHIIDKPSRHEELLNKIHKAARFYLDPDTSVVIRNSTEAINYESFYTETQTYPHQ